MPSKGGEADYPSGTDSFTVDSDVGIGNVFFDPFPCAWTKGQVGLMSLGLMEFFPKAIVSRVSPKGYRIASLRALKAEILFLFWGNDLNTGNKVIQKSANAPSSVHLRKRSGQGQCSSILPCLSYLQSEVRPFLEGDGGRRASGIDLVWIF